MVSSTTPTNLTARARLVGAQTRRTPPAEHTTTCARYILDASPEELVGVFGLSSKPTISPRYNISPSQQVAVIALKADRVRRGLAMLKWGLVPDWSSDGRPGPINARAETVGGLPTFGTRSAAAGASCPRPASKSGRR